ncbi:MAG: hypothetical protein M3N23_13155, partial [Pseudomonadota bacterium]|nr:hypothetical protein [Pseudomonadota bacterium]
MIDELRIHFKRLLKQAPDQLKHGFDRTATWVTQLSWWKFFLFAVLILTAGAITQETLFSSKPQLVLVKQAKQAARANHGSGGLKTPADSDTEVEINNTGIHIHKNRNRDGTSGA